MGINTKYIWCIAYINRGLINKAEEELKIYEYDDVEAYIPTVRVLKKQFKGKQMFEMVPMLFNYGFFKMPYTDACNPEFLMTLRYRISCIYGWVKDPIKTITESPRLRVDNESFIDAIPRAAIATDKEVSRLVKASQSMSIYNQEDLKQFKSGDYIKLEGYPFEGMPAEIIKINHRKGEVIVKLLIDAIVKEVTVSFENVFYTIYKNYNENSRESSSDEIVSKHGQGAMDHITWKKGLTHGQ